MTNRAITILLLCGSLGAAAGPTVYSQGKRGPLPKPAVKPAAGYYSSITAGEMAILMDDIAATNPMLLKRLKEDPELRQQQLENLRQLLALATQAEKEGMAASPTNKQELENIRVEIVAASYDKALNKGKAAAPAFADITGKQVAAFWAAGHEPLFKRFFDAKVTILRSNPDFANRTVSAEERDQARDIFAKMQIRLADYERAKRLGKLTKEMIGRTELNVKLQRAQFLARSYSQANSEKLRATESEIAAYLASHPEFSTTAKKANAQKLLDRAKAGEDFAKLADEYSEDPGNGDPGKKNGGAYRDVPLGGMVKPFETAAMALEPGQIAGQLVESDFGYHIIKLDRKGEKDGRMTYDVRHILIGTTVPNSKPGGRPIPMREYVASQIESEKENELFVRLAAANHISVPADIVIPAVVPGAKRPPVKRKR